MSLSLSRYALTFPSDNEGKVVLFSARTAAAVLMPTRLLERIGNGTVEPDDARVLSDLGLLVPDPGAERREMLSFVGDLEADADTVHAVVVTAQSCNLACTYCYQGPAKGTAVIGPEVSAGIVRFATARVFARGLNLKVTFYGGEPLLALDRVASLAARLQEAAAAHGRAFRFSLITNGTLLTRRAASRLRPLGLRAAQVTLDGPAAVHDLQRPLLGGGGSFRRILANLQETWDLLELQINANYSRQEYAEHFRLLDELLDAGLGPERIGGVSFSPITWESRSPAFEGGCRSGNEPWIVEAAPRLRGEALRRGYRTAPVRPGVCMVDLAHELVVDCDGSFYKCPSFVGDERFRIGDVATGVRQEAVGTYVRDRWRNEECLACPYLPLCFGGCRYQVLQTDGTTAALECRRPYFEACLATLVSQDLAYGLVGSGGARPGPRTSGTGPG